MPRSPTYGEPRTAFVRWFADVGDDVSPELRARLQAGPFLTKVPLVIGSMNSFAVTMVAWYRLDHPALLVFAILECLQLVARFLLMRREGKPADPLFIGGLLWAVLQAATIWVVVASGDLVSMILVLATSLAVIGGIVARNFATPRYAFFQVLAIDLSFKAAFLLSYPTFAPLILVQTFLFAAYNLATLKQHRDMAMRALRAEIESREQALTDPLTRLLNRRGLADEAERRAKSDPSLVLFYIDLDGFKGVNDRLGHGAGDSLLQDVGHRLRDLFGTEAVIGRLGGDEFLVLGSFACDDDIRACGARIVACLSVPYLTEGDSLASIGASVGAARWNDGSGTLESCMALADRALYAAKSAGRGRILLATRPSTKLVDARADVAAA